MSGSLVFSRCVPIEPGRPWPKGRWLSHLHDRVDAQTAIEVADGWRGPFSVLHLQTTGPSEIVSDALACGLVFRGSSANVSVLSNRPGCIEPLITANPCDHLPRSVSDLAWNVVLGNVIGRGTGHCGAFWRCRCMRADADASLA